LADARALVASGKMRERARMAAARRHDWQPLRPRARIDLKDESSLSEQIPEPAGDEEHDQDGDEDVGAEESGGRHRRIDGMKPAGLPLDVVA
jgi:hypothetical protein